VACNACAALSLTLEPGIGFAAGDNVIETKITITKRTPPRELMRACMVLEPLLIREAGLHAIAGNIDRD
jgi:hypothetical protein